MTAMAEDEQATSARPGSWASMEARVARLERQYDEQARVVSGVAVDVAVSRSKLESMETSVGRLADTVGKAMEVIQASVSDSSSTPAGRAIQAAMADRDKESDQIHKELADADRVNAENIMKLRLWIASAGGALLVVSILLNIFGGSIAAALGLPS